MHLCSPLFLLNSTACTHLCHHLVLRAAQHLKCGPLFCNHPLLIYIAEFLSRRLYPLTLSWAVYESACSLHFMEVHPLRLQTARAHTWPVQLPSQQALSCLCLALASPPLPALHSSCRLGPWSCCFSSSMWSLHSLVSALSRADDRHLRQHSYTGPRRVKNGH